MARPRKFVSVGEVFGRLTVLECFAGPLETMAQVRCACGAERVVTAFSLRKGSTRSCGCSHFTGRKPITKALVAWRGARARCFNKNEAQYPNYGGRGITMCAEWATDFSAFERHMGEPPSPAHQLDRIDNDGPYAPGNCRWATRKEQANNKRNNFRLTVGSETKTVNEWAELVGTPAYRLRARIEKLGWTPERALSLGRYDSLRKITKLDREAIKSRRAAGESQHSLARSFGIDQSTVSRIIIGRRVAVRPST